MSLTVIYWSSDQNGFVLGILCNITVTSRIYFNYNRASKELYKNDYVVNQYMKTKRNMSVDTFGKLLSNDGGVVIESERSYLRYKTSQGARAWQQGSKQIRGIMSRQYGVWQKTRSVMNLFTTKAIVPTAIRCSHSETLKTFLWYRSTHQT